VYAKSTDLNQVATSGLYGDLTGTPDLSVYAKSADLNQVATSGLYGDLTGTPNLGVYAKTADLNQVATSGLYADLTGTPNLGVYAKTADLHKVATSGLYADLAQKPNFHPVATSGSYADLVQKPNLGEYAKTSGNQAFDATTLVIDATTNRVGIGTATPQFPLTVNGTIQAGAAVVLGELTVGGKVTTNGDVVFGQSGTVQYKESDQSLKVLGDFQAKVSTVWGLATFDGVVKLNTTVKLQDKTHHRMIGAPAFSQVARQLFDADDGLTARFEIVEAGGWAMLKPRDGCKTTSKTCLAEVVAPVQVPAGATVTELRCYYYDGTGDNEYFSDSKVRLMGPTSAMLAIATLAKSTQQAVAAPQSFADTTITESVKVVTGDKSYFLHATLGVYHYTNNSTANDSIQFHGCRIAFKMPELGF
jgi:hypothetical protein